MTTTTATPVVRWTAGGIRHAGIAVATTADGYTRVRTGRGLLNVPTAALTAVTR